MDNKITANSTIISMLVKLNADKSSEAYDIVEKYVETLGKSGDVYSKIRALLRNRPKQLYKLENLTPELKKLIQLNEIFDDNVYLDEITKALLDELSKEWDNKAIFKDHNLPVRNKLLFHGPTGNGKTTIAKHIAKMVNLPFVEINAGTIINSHVGSSGQNISKIFNQITEPCILFWDEIDTIGKNRGAGDNSAASMENERMVNSILVNIDKLSDDVIFIGATNRMNVLDTAFLRRFDVKYELPVPTIDQKIEFAKQMMDYYKIPNELVSVNWLSHENYSEIKKTLVGIARKHILSNVIN